MTSLDERVATDPLFDVTGKVVVVTGGSRGLGRAMVRAFAERGAVPVIASRKLDACRELADEVGAAWGVDALPIAVNVNRWQECDRLADEVYARYGRVDVLINNAGSSPVFPSVDAITEELYDKVFALNLKGPFRLMANIGTRMASARGGSIINIGSVSSMRPQPMLVTYAAAKAGLNALTEGMARALAPKVRVNCIVAGPFATDVFNAWDPEVFQQVMAEPLALKRAGQPEEVVGAALYLASSASTFTTGALLRVDGGTP
ncbi:SDR family NAD(P)-dependent oxidoreductase [Dactylosporangium sucinum]|uniref:Short chain dehydrogenase/reductase n=1 Tax=Dactylosporangium sucinum TaxID=1424081 RepID=A0A917UEL8_9ACTN|nr:SDR family oxidoreductase [Dactylosporangium sucinum]GGM82730.1 putative short chain dehydrogenase/reductase [Dactylosporangium sucinum]